MAPVFDFRQLITDSLVSCSLHKITDHFARRGRWRMTCSRESRGWRRGPRRATSEQYSILPGERAALF